jgi:hypothetical protein
MSALLAVCASYKISTDQPGLQLDVKIDFQSFYQPMLLTPILYPHRLHERCVSEHFIDCKNIQKEMTVYQEKPVTPLQSRIIITQALSSDILLNNDNQQFPYKDRI